MDLRNLLYIVDSTAKENGLSKPYLVGGFPRDVYIKQINNISDIDITCGDSSSFKLGNLVLGKLKGATLTTFSDGHAKLKFKKFVVDFSSNFKVPDIENILKSSGQNNPSEMQKELYSRDFTANTLLMPLDLSNILDKTGLAFNDLNNKILDTCLPPELTFTYDPRRIIRTIYLIAKLNFVPSGRVIKWISNNGNMLESVGDTYIKNKLNKALELSPEQTIKFIKILKLNDYLPETNLLMKEVRGI